MDIYYCFGDTLQNTILFKNLKNNEQLPQNNEFTIMRGCSHIMSAKKGGARPHFWIEKKKYPLTLQPPSTAFCPLHPEYCTSYRRWLRQILGMNHPDLLHAVSET